MSRIFLPGSIIKQTSGFNSLFADKIAEKPHSMEKQFYREMQEAISRTQKKIDENKDLYVKIKDPLEISILEVSKQIRSIKNMFKTSPLKAVEEMKAYLNKLLAQTGLEISNERVIGRAAKEELGKYGLTSRGRVEDVTGYVKSKNGNSRGVFLLDKNDNILAEALIAPNDKVENYYNAISKDGSAVACELYTRAGKDYGSIALYNKNNELNCSLKLEDNKITYKRAR